MKSITVFTPTYNRQDLLNQCYQSLICQTSKDFVWQIIDDGSTDDTEKLVQSFIKDNKVEIVYIKQNNGGKISAIRKSMEITDTPLWMCLDSDDYLFQNSIELILKYYSDIKNDETVAGLITVRSNQFGTPMQGERYGDIIDSLPKRMKFRDFRYKYNIPPEYAQVYKTRVFRNYRYPYFPGEKFMPESSAYCLIDQSFDLVVIREPIMISEYHADGLTSNHKTIIINNPKGYTYTHAIITECAPTVSCFLHSVICYHMGCALGGEKYNFKRRKLVIKLLQPFGTLIKCIIYGI